MFQLFLNQGENIYETNIDFEFIIQKVFFILDFIKPFLVAFVIVLSIHIVYIVFKTNRLKKEFSIYIDSIFEDHETKEEVKERLLSEWLLIEKKFNSGLDSERKLAIIEADKFVDEILKKMVPSSDDEDMGKRMKRISSNIIPSINNLWKAHKIRNKIVHNPNFQLTENDLNSALEGYKAFLKDSGILD